jgi:hypothetical protein
VNFFEEDLEVQVPAEMLQQAQVGSDIYQKVIPLKPGRYRLNIAAKDQVGGNQTTYEKALDVPHMDEDVLSTSSLILADLIEKVDSKSIGNGPFVIGGAKVRPRMDNAFKRTDKLGIYMQLYNFDVDELTKKPDGTVTYEITKAGTKDNILPPEYSTDEVAKLPGGASQIIVRKLLPLKDVDPGTYNLKITVFDKKRNQTLTRTTTFTVT